MNTARSLTRDAGHVPGSTFDPPWSEHADAAQPSAVTGMLDDDLVDRIRLAVDEHEVAVLLETAGISDRVASERFDAQDVFDLAARLRARLGPRSQQPSPLRDDWYVPPSIAVLRGCCFTVAGLTAVGLAAIDGGRSAALWVMVSCAVWIAVLQGVSFLTYLLMERRAAATPEAAAFPLSVSFLIPVVVGVALAGAVDASTGVLTGAAMLNLTAIVLLLTVQRPLVVSMIVLPVGVVALAAIIGAPISIRVALGLWIGGGVALSAVCLVVLGKDWSPAPVPLDRADTAAALPFVIAGLGVGALSLAVATSASRSPVMDGAQPWRWFVATSPFLILVSLAELVVIRIRRGLLSMTTRVRDLRSFHDQAQRMLLREWAMELGAAAVMALAAAGILWLSGGRGDFLDALALVSGFGLLGLSLVAGLLLLSCDDVTTVAVILWAGTAAVSIAVAVADGWAVSSLLVVAVVAATSITSASRAAGEIRSYR